MTPQQAIDAARLAADLLLTLVPAPAAKQLIDDAAVRRANAAYAVAEAVKFGPPPASSDDE